MALIILIGIMLCCGFLGGWLNFLLPANDNQTGQKIKPFYHCLILGLGATLIVPLFLEVAQSKLLDHLHVVTHDEHTVWKIIADPGPSSKNKKNVQGDTTAKDSSIDKVSTRSIDLEMDPLKGYMLYAAYCLLAAAAGGRFINANINSFVKEENINLKTRNIGLVKINEKLDAQNKLNARKNETQVFKNLSEAGSDTAGKRPEIGPIKHANDPQKGRFGGLSKRNNRVLKADVVLSETPQAYLVTIWVESTAPDQPLNSEVIFYLHDSFSPSICIVQPEDFVDGKAAYDEIIAYGAFTVGVITDNGKTLLELDLADQEEFPKEFRER